MKDKRRKSGIKSTVPVIQIYTDGSKTFRIFDGKTLVITVHRPKIKRETSVAAILKRLGYVLNSDLEKTDWGYQADLYCVR